MQVEAITGSIVLDENPALRAEKAVVAGVRQMKSDVENVNAQAAKNVANGWKDTLKDINGEFGKKSFLGQGLKLAMGGGAIAGVGMAAREWEDFTGKISDAADAMRRGDESAKDLAGNLLREVPILGTITKGFDNISEAITGEKYAIELVNREAQLTTQFFNDQVAAAKNLKNTLRSISDEIDRANSAAKTAAIDNPLEARITGLRDAQEAGWKKNQKDRDADIAAQNALTNKAIADQQKLKDNLKAQWSNDIGMVAPTMKNVDLLAHAQKTHKPTAEEYAVIQQLNFTTPNSEQIRDQMISMITDLNNAETQRKRVIEQGEKAVEEIKRKYSDKMVADDAEANAQIARAQRDAGKEIVKVNEEAAKRAMEVRMQVAKDQLADFRQAWEQSQQMAAKPHSFEQLPSPVLQAEEIFGSKSVAGSGPPGWVESTKENTDATRENTEELKAARSLSKVIAPVVTIAIQGGF